MRAVPGELWTVHEGQIGDGPGLALAIEVTRPTAEDVRIYAGNSLPGIGRMLVVTIAGGTRTRRRSGAPTTPGRSRATSARSSRRAARPRSEAAPVHVFASVPVALAYLIGREGRAFGRSDHLRVRLRQPHARRLHAGVPPAADRLRED